MSKESSIVFFDIDGTIYDHRTQRVEPSTSKAIRMLVENGHLPVLCTGRAKSMIPEAVLAEDFKGLVGSCGTYVEFENQLILDKVLTKEELQTVWKACERYQIRAMFEGKEGLYYIKSMNLFEYIQRTFDLASKYKNVLPLCPDCGINKLTVHFQEDEELTCFLAETNHILDAIIHKEAGGYHYAECVPRGYTKAVGIEKLLHYLNIDRRFSYAFGDSVNDLEMLEYVEYGIAMGNSSEEVKKRAKYCTTGLYEHGIYRGLKAFSLVS